METTPIDYSQDATFEDIRAILRDVAKSQKKTAREIREIQRIGERERNEMRKIAEQEWRELRESLKETSELQRETDKRIGKLGNRLGEMIEYMVKPCLLEKFREMGFDFTKAYSQATIEDDKNNIITEIDITLENGDEVMIVEVKSKPTINDITDHIERMEKVRRHADLHGDRRILLGTVAGMIMNRSEKIFALKNGFYVAEPSGETFDITVPEGVYTPREW